MNSVENNAAQKSSRNSEDYVNVCINPEMWNVHYFLLSTNSPQFLNFIHFFNPNSK